MKKKIIYKCRLVNSLEIINIYKAINNESDIKYFRINHNCFVFMTDKRDTRVL